MYQLSNSFEHQGAYNVFTGKYQTSVYNTCVEIWKWKKSNKIDIIPKKGERRNNSMWTLRNLILNCFNTFCSLKGRKSVSFQTILRARLRCTTLFAQSREGFYRLIAMKLRRINTLDSIKHYSIHQYLLIHFKR